ncbi:hypothetical protein Ancab_005669 [Ancistrocladus abbreviatus]
MLFSTWCLFWICRGSLFIQLECQWSLAGTLELWHCLFGGIAVARTACPAVNPVLSLLMLLLRVQTCLKKKLLVIPNDLAKRKAWA